MKVKEQEEVLQRARETYGSKNQILVCIEELNELACVLAKYPRYEDEKEAREKLHDSVLDEVADVIIILDHVQSILGLEDEDIAKRISQKISRLERWLIQSESMQRTVEDREVVPDCSTCRHKKNIGHSYNVGICPACLKAEATEGIKPFYEKE